MPTVVITRVTRPRRSIEERLLAQVVKTPGCWLWRGAVSSPDPKKAYGKINNGNGRNLSVHRVAYSLWKGPIPTRVRVLHHCEINICVNPDHLYLGVPKWKPGQINGRAKLTPEHVAAIREYLRQGVDKAVLCSKYGVSRSSVNRIARGAAWRDYVSQTYVSDSSKLSPSPSC